VPTNKTFPPKFSQNIIYPAQLDLDEVDFTDAPFYNSQTRTGIVGQQSLGVYFDIEFPGHTPNTIPTLSYGKHIFTISVNPNPGGYGASYPLLRPGSKILFEVKDAQDSNGNRRVIYSDVTPIYSAGNSSFLAYLWIKQDPLRTYELIENGFGQISLVGLTETRDEYWKNRYNVRSNLSININTETSYTSETDGLTYSYYNDNLSPIVFKKPDKMVSGSGFHCNERVLDTAVGDERSALIITASNLQTYSGKIHSIKTQFWLSGSVASSAGSNDWKDLGYASHILSGNEYEDEIDSNYSEGINPKIEKWFHEIDERDIPHGRVTDDGNSNKVKFRFRFYDIQGNPTLSILPISGSEVESGTTSEFTVDYPTGDPASNNYIDSDGNWLIWEGSGVILTGTTIFNANNPMLLQTGAGEFHFGQASFSVISGYSQRFDAEGKSQVVSQKRVQPNK